jgi:DNA-binding NtrC family response regulator
MSEVVRSVEPGETGTGALRARPIAVIADDDADLRRLVAAAARRAGFSVLQAADGPTLSRLLRTLVARQRWPAVVLTDASMPGCDGLDALFAARSLTPGVPVLMMTGTADARLRARATVCGAVEVLSKPLDLGALQRLLRIFVPAG